MACVVKRKNKSGADRWVVDFYDQHGRRRWRVFREEGEAHRWYSELKPQLQANTYRGPEALPTFAAVAEEWLTIRQDRAPGTVTFWRTQIDLHLVPAFGTKRIDQITMQMVNAWKMQAWNREDRTKPGLSRTTVNQVLQTLRGIFKHAVTAEYIRRTPAGEVEGIRKQRQPGRHGRAIEKQKVLTEAQVARVIAAARPGLFRTFVMTAFLTGCRSGELLALKWENLDLDAGALHVVESLSRQRGALGANGRAGYGSSTPINGAPKSDSSRRTMELPAELVRTLKEWKMSRHPLFKRDGEYVFSTSTGKPFHRSYLTKGLHAALAAVGLPKISLHGCRHTFGSILIARGKPPTQVADLMGHKDAQITIERYAHWFKGESSRGTTEELAGAMLGSGGR